LIYNIDLHTTFVTLKAVNFTVFQFIRSGLGLQVVLNHVVRLESDIYLRIAEQVCNFLYHKTIKSEIDPILALRVSCDPCCMLLFFKYFLS
jgi:hypothetical protein